MKQWHAQNRGYYFDYYIHTILPKRIAAGRARVAALKAELAALA